jgi:hypothetical protein
MQKKYQSRLSRKKWAVGYFLRAWGPLKASLGRLRKHPIAHLTFIQSVCIFSVFFMVAGGVSPAAGLEPANDDLEINRLKKEVAQVKTERQRVREDIVKDKSENAAYVERTASRKAGYSTETDSVHRLTASFEHKKDSLDAIVAAVESKKRNFDLLKDRFREHIVSACGKLMGAIKRFPPAVSRPATGALTFLLNDCSSKDIDNREALQRFVQITKNLDEMTLSIQTGQESSPAPTLKGTVSMLRIGLVFQAAVDEDAKKAAIWQSNEDGSPQWQAIPDEKGASMISKAIAVRESKSLPAFIPLPWGSYLPKEGSK